MEVEVGIYIEKSFEQCFCDVVKSDGFDSRVFWCESRSTNVWIEEKGKNKGLLFHGEPTLLEALSDTGFDRSVDLCRAIDPIQITEHQKDLIQSGIGRLHAFGGNGKRFQEDFHPGNLISREEAIADRLTR